MNVLIAGEDADLLGVLSVAFRQWGLNVETTSLGEAAVRQARSSAPDVVVIDDSGEPARSMETYRAIRRETKAGCVILSPRPWSIWPADQALLPDEAVIEKPFSTRHLARCLRRVALRQAVAAAQTAGGAPLTTQSRDD